MNQKVVQELNHLQVERAELKTYLKDLEVNKSAYLETEYIEESDIEDTKKEIASIESKINDLGSHLYDEEDTDEE